MSVKVIHHLFLGMCSGSECASKQHFAGFRVVWQYFSVTGAPSCRLFRNGLPGHRVRFTDTLAAVQLEMIDQFHQLGGTRRQ